MVDSNRFSPLASPSPLISRRTLITGIGVAIAAGIGAGLAGIHTQEEQAARDAAAQKLADKKRKAAAAKKKAEEALNPKQAATPRSEWRQGSIPYIYQIDKEWADKPYAGDTIKKSGCGPTSLSMVYVFFTGKRDMDPAAMATFSEQNGYVQNGLTAWTLMSEGAAKLGLTSKSIGPSESAITSALQAGHPIIVSVRPGDFTKVGHFMVLSAISSDRYLSIHDPNSKKNSALLWDIDRVLGQIAAAWEFI